MCGYVNALYETVAKHPKVHCSFSISLHICEPQRVHKHMCPVSNPTALHNSEEFGLKSLCSVFNEISFLLCGLLFWSLSVFVAEAYFMTSFYTKRF